MTTTKPTDGGVAVGGSAGAGGLVGGGGWVAVGGLVRVGGEFGVKVGLGIGVGVGVGVKVGIGVGEGEGLGVGVKVGTGVGVAKVTTAFSGAAKFGRGSQAGSTLKIVRPMTARTTKIRQPRIKIWLRIGFIPAIINQPRMMSKTDQAGGIWRGIFRICD